MRCWTQAARALGDIRERHVEFERHRGRREHVGQIRTADERRRQLRVAACRGNMRRDALDAPVDNLHGAHVGLAIDPERHHTTGKPRRPRRNAFVVGVGDQDRAACRTLEDLRLRIRNRLDRSEEPEVGFAHIGPDAHVGLGNANQRADLPCVIHPQLDDGDLRPLAQLDERQRQPDVIVEVSAVANDAVSRREKLRRNFFRRGLSCAAGDGHDFCA